MFTQFFGQFLLNNDLISAGELNIVFQSIKSTRLRLGMIAIDKGFLTPSQVVVINGLQKKHDKRFGEIAVEFGYLTEENLDCDKILPINKSSICEASLIIASSRPYCLMTSYIDRTSDFIKRKWWSR